jgi:LETM1 and EF-hand domain-containing protein 1, mitochondrial
MASRALIGQRNHLLDHFSSPVRTISQIRSISHDVSSPSKASISDSSKENETYFSIVSNEILLSLHKQRVFTSPHGKIITQDFAPIGARFFLQSVRPASTSTAAARHLQSDSETNEEQKQKQAKNEASPEECDQAVEGLSSAKAKAKAKVLEQEAQKQVQSVVKKFWSMILGIGPALKAVASMSRYRIGTFVFYYVTPFLLQQQQQQSL